MLPTPLAPLDEADSLRIRERFLLDPAVAFLNHGSFGSCPREVLDEQTRLRERLEREPVLFFQRDLEGLLDEARAAVAAFVGATAEDLAFVPNASMGVMSVLASTRFAPGDEILVTSHTYGAVKNAAVRTAERAGARVVTAPLPFPVRDAGDVTDVILAHASPRTRLAIVDAVTSPTALVLPFEEIVRALEARGVPVLLDAAHAPGMLPLALDALGASYTTANLHKWCCAPKGAAFLHVRRDRQATVHPAVTSHGMTSGRTDRSRYLVEFDWTGTDDPTAALSVPAALRFLAGLVPGGLGELHARQRGAALAGRALLAARLGVTPPCPDAMIGAMATLHLPDAPAGQEELAIGEPLWLALAERHRVQVPLFPFPERPKRLVRISTPLYATQAEVARLADALDAELAAERAAG